MSRRPPAPDHRRRWPLALLASLVTLLLAACSVAPPQGERPVFGKTGKKGGYYLDDGPLADTPENLDRIPDAEPRDEPIHKAASRPYVVFGRAYSPHTAPGPYKARGIASWYGKKFHGQKTSTGERYDMFAMTAAHKTLALPSYARVTNLANGRQVVVRVNDRGPFHDGRIIDLSYAAAHRLGIIGQGSGQVEVEAVFAGDSGSRTIAQAPAPTRPARPRDGGTDDELGSLIAELDQPAPTASGIYLQLAAFSSRDTADSYKQHLERELEELGQPLRVQPAGKLHRVQLGPFSDRASAESAAARVEQALGVRPAISPR